MHSQIKNMCTLFFTLPGISNLLFKSLIYIQMRPYVVNKIILNMSIHRQEDDWKTNFYIWPQKVPCKIFPFDSCSYTDPENCNVSADQVINLPLIPKHLKISKQSRIRKRFHMVRMSCLMSDGIGK